MNETPFSYIFVLASAGTTFVKLLVDVYKTARPGPRPWEAPVLAVVSGILVLLLLFLATGQPITGQTAAQAVLAGVLAGGGAVGVTAMHKAARAEKEDL